jgi:hypothetical protein
VPEVGNAELFRLVPEGVCGLGRLVCASALCVDLGYYFGVLIEIGDEGEVVLVVFSKEGVCVGQRSREDLY